MKNYPIKCVSCCQREVFPEILPEHIFQETLVKDVPITKCKNCGNIYFTDESDDYMRNYKYVATRLRQFLTDDEIKNGFLGFREKIK